MNLQKLKSLINYNFGIREKPLVLQMPITSRCNSRCKTCNVWKFHENIDIDATALKMALKDSFFSEVSSVGINGGEFTLVPTFLDILDSVLTLPKIKNIHLISNGLFPKRLFEYLAESKIRCAKKNVLLHICISVDGYGERHEIVRGIQNCFSKTKIIIDTLYNHSEKYCNSFSVGCTISLHNINYIKETQDFFNSYKNLQVEYHCAIPNKRIKTFNKADYYVLNDEKKRLLTAEFFYERYRNSTNLNQRYQNFSNFYFLIHNGRQRINTCAYYHRDVTIDENLNLILCATASDIIGNLRNESASKLIKSHKCRSIQKKIKHYCNNCGHYSYHPLTIRGRLAYINYEMQNKFALSFYELDRTNHYRYIFNLLRFAKNCIKEYLRQIYYLLWKLQ